jgi:hypothetical protein
MSEVTMSCGDCGSELILSVTDDNEERLLLFATRFAESHTTSCNYMTPVLVDTEGRKGTKVGGAGRKVSPIGEPDKTGD